MTQQDFFSRYTFSIRTDKIGGGSFGSVYKAYDNTHHEHVAIKVAEVQTIGSKEFSLKSEIDNAQIIPDHPNVALYKRVYQFEMPNGLFDYAIMKYYPHGSLKSLLDEGSIFVEQKKDIADQLLSGVQHLHDNGILHRDLKPANILIHHYDNKIIPIIADFGLSKLSIAEGSRISNSFGGGTLEYSAPEQLLGRELRYNADLWALGVIIYELFLGKRPFEASNSNSSAEAQRQEIYEKIVSKPIPNDVGKIPIPYSSFVTSFLVKDPNLRGDKISNNRVSGSNDSDCSNIEKTHLFSSVTQSNLIDANENILENYKEEDDIKKSNSRSKIFLKTLVLVIILSSFFITSFYFFDIDLNFFKNYYNGNNENIEFSETNTINSNDNDKSEYYEAEKKNTISAYQKYLNENPKGNYRTSAKRNLEKLESGKASKSKTNKDWISNDYSKNNYKTYRVKIFTSHPKYKTEPAMFETISEQVLSETSHNTGDQYETITEQVLENDGYSYYKLSELNKESVVIDESTGKRKVIKKFKFYDEPKIVVVAPVYKTRTYKYYLSTGSNNAPRYSTRTYRKLVSNGNYTNNTSRSYDIINIKLSDTKSLESFMTQNGIHDYTVLN